MHKFNNNIIPVGDFHKPTKITPYFKFNAIENNNSMHHFFLPTQSPVSGRGSMQVQPLYFQLELRRIGYALENVEINLFPCISPGSLKITSLFYAPKCEAKMV